MITPPVPLDVIGLEKHCDYSAKARTSVVYADCREAHALREGDDLCHGANVALASTSLPTMIDGAFQGGA
ncbi:TPA: hypothetical protein QDZ34_000895 [Stenotrophomonas maltophilia]|nr:hypothetical protein [Stenotrophomonas maltophilia]HDS1024627.1 hypothetical protein [Stenotrophomonas maltophilia]HDS1029011.1 hypothetical protein [Stenotrophomonas maltophilia]HDS1033579.1 hypothetical protein [Stenotrophomonas maltophilia]